jgi:hypothetical protein
VMNIAEVFSKPIKVVKLAGDSNPGQ